MNTDLQVDVLVVGAGISGLLAAEWLQTRGARVLLLDKGRGVGGRMATRRTDTAIFDHGAQFFTARDPELRSRVETWQTEGIVKAWSTGFALEDGTFKNDGEIRYCGVNGMASIAKHLARGLDVRVQAKVVSLHREGDAWTVVTEGGERFVSRACILTSPVPQSLELLAKSNCAIPESIRGELEQIEYAPCLAVLAELAGPSRIPQPGGQWFKGEPISWMADNRLKGVSSGAGSAVTIHGGKEWSRTHWETAEAEVIAGLLAAASPWLGEVPIRTQLHRWRYSVPVRVHPERSVMFGETAPLLFAGDAFGGPRVEGAALSGLAAAAALARQLRFPSLSQPGA